MTTGARHLQREYGTIVGQEDFAAYVTGLRLQYKIDINKSALEEQASAYSVFSPDW
jgi:hypothetical protein